MLALNVWDRLIGNIVQVHTYVSTYRYLDAISRIK